MSFMLYYPDRTSLELTSDVENNSLRFNARCDEAFASGSCRIITSLLTQNIPPYTLCEIDGTQWLISSECTKYQNVADLYVHNVQLLEPTAILECFILGTKVLSTGNDKAKLQKVLDLISDKYNVSVAMDVAINSLLENQTNDYVFGSGTTLFEVISQMLVRLNYRPKVMTMHYDTNGVLQIGVFFTNLISSSTAYTLDWNRITQHTFNQNNDNYSLYLETEANNVVDRNNLTYDLHLTIRNHGETRLTLDNGKLYTTSKIESISKFEVVGEVKTFSINKMAGVDFFNNYFTGTTQISDGTLRQYDTTTLYAERKTLQQWTKLANATDKALIRSKIQEYCNYAGIVYSDLMNNYEFKCIASQDGVTNQFYYYDEDGTHYRDPYFELQCTETIRTKTDITDYILEKNVYDAENYAIQPKYCYYTKGSNIIDGLHVIRNDDLWTKIAAAITGGVSGPMLDVMANDKHYEAYNTTKFYGTSVHGCEFAVGWCKTYTGNAGTNGPTFNYDTVLYNVEYVPINNPKMIEEKVDTPDNETAYKDFTRTYQVSASQIDYDRLTDSMKQYCDMLGKQELTVEYDITGVVTLPALAQQISVLSKTFYLMSYEIVQHTTHKVMTLNLCKSYYKVADAVGVAYQYNATRLPIEGIVERPIYITINNLSAELDENCLLKFHFFTLNGNNVETFGKNLATRYSLMKNGNKVVAYCEADDQFSFASNVKQYDTYEVNEFVPYADENSEFVYAQVQIIKLNNPLTQAQSKLLPEIPNNMYSVQIAGSRNYILHKDPREKLTFTIDIKYVTQ